MNMNSYSTNLTNMSVRMEKGKKTSIFNYQALFRALLRQTNTYVCMNI